MRKRTWTENIGCYITPSECTVLKAEMQRRWCTVSAYLRQVAVQPWLEAKAEVGPDSMQEYPRADKQQPQR
jgi:hypothetical protein